MPHRGVNRLMPHSVVSSAKVICVEDLFVMLIKSLIRRKKLEVPKQSLCWTPCLTFVQLENFINVINVIYMYSKIPVIQIRLIKFKIFCH